MKVIHVFTILTTPKSFFDGQFRYLVNHGQEIWVTTSSVIDSDFSERNSINYVRLPIERKIAPLSDFRSIISLIRLIRKEKFDVVVGHTPKGAMVAMIAALLAGTRARVYYRHGLIYTTATGVKRYIFKTVERLTSMCANRIVNVSDSLCKLAITDNLNNKSKQTLIGHGTCSGIDAKTLFNPKKINEDRLLKFKNLYHLADDCFVIGFCGRLCKDKGIIELIEGFIEFRNLHSELYPKLLLVGPHDERDILPDGIKLIIDTDADIIATGFMQKTDLPYMYSLMDVFVFPSFREGFGMCVIEASAMQCPVLVSKSHGCVDSILEGKTGEYINLSSQGVTNGIVSMLSKEKRLMYGKNGRSWVINNFDYSVLWPKILDFYNTCCK